MDHMVFNASKCYKMHISRLSSSEQFMYQLCGVVLSSVTSEKYLVVYLNHDLKWSHHVDQVAAKPRHHGSWVSSGEISEVRMLTARSWHTLH